MIRQAQPQDALAVMEVVASAFRLTPDSPRRAQISQEVQTQPAHWVVYEADGQLLGAAHLHPVDLRFGPAVVRQVSVGEVAIHAARHGQGHGSQLLTQLNDFLAQQAIPLARLGGLFSFYQRFGYTRFCRCYTEFSLGGTASAGASVFTEGALPLTPEDAHCLTPSSLARVPAEHAALYNAYVAEHLGHVRMSADAPLGDRWRVLEYRQAGELLGFVQVLTNPAGGSEFEGPVAIERLAYRRAHPQALRGLIAWCCNFTLEQGAGRMTARLPRDPHLLSALAPLPVRWRCAETFGGIGGNMLRVVDLARLLHSLLPLLQHRLEQLPPWRGMVEVTWRVAGQQAALRLTPRRVRVVDASADPATLTVDCPPADFLRLLLGLTSYPAGAGAARCSRAPTPREAQLLATLWPPAITHAGDWG